MAAAMEVCRRCIFAAVLLAIRLRVSIWATLGHTLNSDEVVVFFEAFHVFLIFLNSILGAIIGIHFQALNISPLETHLGIILLFIMATIVYIIAYLEIKLHTQDAAYLFIFRLVCLVSGILSVELLVTLIVSPVWLLMVNLCPILIIGVLRHWYQGIYQGLYDTADMVLKAVHILYNKIYGLLYWMYGRLLQISQSGASNAISSREGDIEMQLALIVG
uniref:Uncharacterized protein n=1 Tax=Quercus lobata TaxID=97700 RepID=A0A7N2MR76_QUELO